MVGSDCPVGDGSMTVSERDKGQPELNSGLV